MVDENPLYITTEVKKTSMVHLLLRRGANPEPMLNRLYRKDNIPKPSQDRMYDLLVDAKKKQKYYALLNVPYVKFASQAVEL